jgi:hypothetical protein
VAELGRKAALGGVERYNLVVEPLLLDRENMAAALCISASLLDELKDAGCPTVAVPTTDKTLFDPKEVVAWMKSFRHAQDIALTPLGHELRNQQQNRPPEQN